MNTNPDINYSDEIAETLQALAQRYHGSEEDDWYKFVWIEDLVLVRKCLICNATVVVDVDDALTGYQKIQLHGIQHLKEHNLLPFI